MHGSTHEHHGSTHAHTHTHEAHLEGHELGDEEFEEYTDEHGVVKKRSLGRRILDKLTGKSHTHAHGHV